MPPAPRKAAARGRRDPALLQNSPAETGDAMLDQHVGDELEEEHGGGDGDGSGFEVPTESLLFDGDIVTCSATLAVDTTGNGKTDFIGYRATSRVQPEEDHADVFGRVAGVVGDGVISAAIEVSQRWEQYEAELAERDAELARIAGRRQ